MAEDLLYHALREQVEGLLVEGRLHRSRAGQAEKVETYWAIGDALIRHLQTRPDPAYGQRIVSNLSKDTHLDLSTLYDILRLRRLLPAFRARGELSWSHYRTLVHLPDLEQLRYYEGLAGDGAWTTRQLRQAIDADRGGDLLPADPDMPATPLRARFGQLATYRVVADPLQPGGPPAIDFGFYQIWVPADLPGFDEARPDAVVTLAAGGDGRVRAALRTDRPVLWTYVARISRLVDADTLNAVVDLGLGHRACPRLRLRGIDCPEAYTQAGQRAADFVQQALASVAFVIIATRRTDIYGRYLTDLKYLPGETDPQAVLERGTYLNRQLLDEHLARRYLDAE